MEGRRGLRPAGAEPDVRVHTAEVGEAVVEPLRDPVGVRLHAIDRVALGAVVGEEQDERVVVLPGVLQELQQAPDVMVEVLDHRGVELHRAGLAPLLVRAELVPGPRERRAWRLGGLGRHDAVPACALEAPRAQHVVAAVVRAPVAVELGVGHLERPVRRGVGGVGEEGPAIVEAAADGLDQPVGVVLGRVEARGQRDRAAVFAIGRQRMAFDDPGSIREVAGAARQECEGPLEAPALGPLPLFHPQVPLAGHVGVVAGVAQQRRHRHDPVRQVAFVAGAALLVFVRLSRHRAEPRRVRVDAGEQHRPRGRAGW